MMNVRRIAPLTLMVALALSGCGHRSNYPTPSSSDPAAIRAAWLNYSQCVRQHGVPDFPDVTVDATGHVVPDPNAPRVPDAAVQACQDRVRDVPQWSDETPPPTAADLVALRRYADCLRHNGYPTWPDPDSGGRFPVDSADAKRLAANPPAACASLEPANGVPVTATG